MLKMTTPLSLSKQTWVCRQNGLQITFLVSYSCHVCIGGVHCYGSMFTVIAARGLEEWAAAETCPPTACQTTIRSLPVSVASLVGNWNAQPPALLLDSPLSNISLTFLWASQCQGLFPWFVSLLLFPPHLVLAAEPSAWTWWARCVV